MKTSNISIAQFVFLILTVVFFVLAILFGVFVSIVSAAVCVIIATVCFVLGMLLSDKEKAPAVVAESRYSSGNSQEAEKADMSPAEKQVPIVNNKPDSKQEKHAVFKGFPNSIIIENRDYDLIDQVFGVKADCENSDGSIPLGVPLSLTVDKGNVKIYHEETPVGYVNDEKIVRMVSAWQKKKNYAYAKAFEDDGVSLVVAFFSPHPTKGAYLRSGIPSKSFKLGGVNSEEFESYAEDLSTGDELEFEYSNADDRYENLAGYLPRNANAFIEEDPTIGFVESVETDDDDKLKVYVTVYERPIEIEMPDELLKKDEESPYEEEAFIVKGVTFNTGVSGRKTRQGILRSIYFKDPPFDEDFEIVPKVYEYEGKPAVGLYVNGDDNEQIGNIPKEAATRIANMMDRYVGSSIKVYGGGDHNWGAEITLRFSKTND